MVSHYNGGIELGIVEAVIESGYATEQDLMLKKELDFLPKNRAMINIENERYCLCLDTYCLFKIQKEGLESLFIEDIIKILSRKNINPVVKYDSFNCQFELIYNTKDNKYVHGETLEEAFRMLFLKFFA